jgi:hypothetical protein
MGAIDCSASNRWKLTNKIKRTFLSYIRRVSYRFDGDGSKIFSSDVGALSPPLHPPFGTERKKNGNAGTMVSSDSAGASK